MVEIYFILPHHCAAKFKKLLLLQVTYRSIYLTHWGRVTHICVGKLTIISSDNGLSPERRQVIIWTNSGVLLIGPLGTNFSEILIEIRTFSLKKIRLKMSSAKWRLFGVGLNEFMDWFRSLCMIAVLWFSSDCRRKSNELMVILTAVGGYLLRMRQAHPGNKVTSLIHPKSIWNLNLNVRGPNYSVST